MNGAKGGCRPEHERLAALLSLVRPLEHECPVSAHLEVSLIPHNPPPPTHTSGFCDHSLCGTARPARRVGNIDRHATLGALVLRGEQLSHLRFWNELGVLALQWCTAAWASLLVPAWQSAVALRANELRRLLRLIDLLGFVQADDGQSVDPADDVSDLMPYRFDL